MQTFENDIHYAYDNVFITLNFHKRSTSHWFCHSIYSNHLPLNCTSQCRLMVTRWCSGYDVGLATFALLVRVPVMTLLGYF